MAELIKCIFEAAHTAFRKKHTERHINVPSAPLRGEGVVAAREVAAREAARRVAAAMAAATHHILTVLRQHSHSTHTQHSDSTQTALT